MTEVEIDGYAYIGYLSIPTVDLELPVLSECDKERLKLGGCRYSGSTKTDDLVICGHNYARLFGKHAKLKAGDQVYFFDMDDILSCYEVIEVEALAPTAIEEMTVSEYDLTLFTCTSDLRSRLAIRCERVTE